MRGGTSRCLVFHERDLPPAGVERDYILLAALGSPDPYGRQLDGLGGGISSLSKACIIGPSNHPAADVDYIFARDQAAQCLDIWDDLASLTLIGHSHLCKSFALSPEGVHEVVSDKFELRPGWKYIVSVGSVGQPRDYDPRASYTLYDTDKRVFEFRRVEYDIKASAEKIFSTDLEPNFGHRLFIGV